MNIKEIAQLAGVSTSTVSKIVNQKDESISQETRERVLKIVKEGDFIWQRTVQTEVADEFGPVTSQCPWQKNCKKVRLFG